MYRIETNIHEKELCVKLVIYKDYKIIILLHVYLLYIMSLKLRYLSGSGDSWPQIFSSRDRVLVSHIGGCAMLHIEVMCDL